MKEKCRGSNRVGYCPFPALCRDTVMVSRREGRDVHGRQAYAHDREPTCACGVPREAYRDRPPWVLYRDRVGSPCVTIWVFNGTIRLWQLGLLCRDMTFMSRQLYFSVEPKSVVTEFSLSR